MFVEYVDIFHILVPQIMLVYIWKANEASDVKRRGQKNIQNKASKNVKENEFLEDESIYRQSLSCGRLQMRGTKFKCGRSCEHKSRDFPD